MLCSWHGSLLVLICNVNLKHFKPNSGLLNSKGLLSICMSADASNRPCQQDGGVEALLALYIRGNFGCSKLFCTLPCNSKSWASRITLPRAHVRNFSTNSQLTSYTCEIRLLPVTHRLIILILALDSGHTRLLLSCMVIDTEKSVTRYAHTDISLSCTSFRRHFRWFSFSSTTSRMDDRWSKSVFIPQI